MTGRESKEANNLFYTCSLIAFIARQTKQTPAAVVNYLGKEKLNKIYNLADIYHSDNIENVSDDFIEVCNIPDGDFDNVAECHYSVPTHWDIGKVYKRLIIMVAEAEKKTVIEALLEVYQSFISRLIEDYNGSFYYENPQTIFANYQNGAVILE